MYLIKTCPSCKTKLRFPIDKGTIKVKCPCGYSFVANPDNSDIYKDASFDLSRSTCGLKRMTRLKRMMDGTKFDQFAPIIINKIFDLKYKIQNFRLLPAAEKKKFLIAFGIVGAAIVGIIVILYVLNQGLNSNGKIII
jgi:hypothetical protein